MYAALQHGHCITRWNANRREIVECMDCRQLLVEGETGESECVCEFVCVSVSVCVCVCMCECGSEFKGSLEVKYVFDCYSTTTGDVGTSSLYFCDSFFYIGLAEGQVIIMDAISFKPLTILRCHRSQVRSFLPINLSLLQSRASSSTSTPSHKTSTSSFSPLHTASPLLSPYRTGLLQVSATIYHGLK